MLNHEEVIKWMKLTRCKGVKDETKKTLIEAYKDINIAWDKFQSLILKTKKQDSIKIPLDSEIEKEIEKIYKFGGDIIHLNHELYPELLKNIFNAPNILLVKGNVKLLTGLNFSVVGSRIPTAVGIQFTQKITSDLINNNFNIVSGLATGIDAVAHKTALDCKHKDNSTIAVLGNGLGKVYPRENSYIYDRICSENGLLVSEFEFDSTPIPSRFPRRNATIAGMSFGTLIIEARKNSGSLITARYAQSFNRDVYAVPGFPSDARCDGTNYLIKHNIAKITTCVEDILEDLPKNVNSSMVKERFDNFVGNISANLEKDENYGYVELDESIRSEHKETFADAKIELCNLISSTPVGIEQIRSCMPQFSIKSILISLLELELEDIVVRGFDGKLQKIDNQTQLLF